MDTHHATPSFPGITLANGWHPRLPTPSLLSLTPAHPNPLKKSHARKRPADHVPRPRNAFILFRCDVVRDGAVIPRSVEKDHRNLSRIAGLMWAQMTPVMREPWVDMARREKAAHALRWPDGAVRKKTREPTPTPIPLSYDIITASRRGSLTFPWSESWTSQVSDNKDIDFEWQPPPSSDYLSSFSYPSYSSPKISPLDSPLL